ncbi:MAG TPA: PrgI family protein [Candidatus Saccharimonadales bacterium]|nr:PrgI family protein [Candidatus Saccharimonadales bacterium]
MDNHPIPQDVTHFQFKLIGNLTLKQFGYVGAGGISAWIAISTGAPFLIKLLIAMILAGGGLVFAFVPIEGRPADLMMTYFFKALFQPNQYLFKKQEGYNELMATQPAPTTIVAPTSPQQNSRQQAAQLFMAQQRNMMPSGMPIMQPTQTVPQPISAAALQPTQRPTTPIPTATISPLPATPTAPVTSPLDIAPIQAPPVSRQPMPTPTPSIPNPIIRPVVTPPAVQPQENVALQEVMAQKKQLEEQLALLQKQLSEKPQQVTPTPAPVEQTPVQPAPTAVSPVIKTMPATQKTSQAPMVSDFPNIIMGVVKDARGNVLPNILIEVKDNDDNPVRAFKTNALGQFASATPLLNGTYTILFEDPAKTHNFDALQIEASGEIMQPVEVISHDQREDLRKELFG